LTINYVIDGIGDLRFYVFRGERIKNDYIKYCKPRTCMVMHEKTWMIAFLFKEFLSFFKRSIIGGIFHPLIGIY
jgi:hypothetical protein